MKRINPDTLKMHRKCARLSQQGLAKVSRVSKKTIARIEGGKSSANNHTAKQLAKALRVAPEVLSEPFINGKHVNRAFGYQTFDVTIEANAEFAFQMVERCYGFSREDQITMAPIFTALLAEASLAWRQESLQQAEEYLNKLRKPIDGGSPLADKEVANLERALLAERESIEQRDFRLTSPFRQSFQRYLDHFNQQLDTDLIQNATNLNQDRYDIYRFSVGGWAINLAELKRLVGRDTWAFRALQWGYVKIRDIPDDLMGDDVSGKRYAWLAEKIPQDERDEYEAWEHGVNYAQQLEAIGTERGDVEWNEIVKESYDTRQKQQ